MPPLDDATNPQPAEALFPNTDASAPLPEQPLNPAERQRAGGFPARFAKLIRLHFENYRRMAPWEFIWKISVEGLAVSVVLAFLLDWFTAIEPRSDLVGQSLPQLFIGAVLVAPVLETLLMQSVPISLARGVRLGFSGQVGFSALLFAVAHFWVAGVGSGICAGIVGGFYLAFTYAHWRERSFSHALWITIGTHAVRNLAAVAALFVTSRFSAS